ncbi:MAG: hypothetical protein WKG00_08450 [Polyangiaceae bacterium]
MAFNRALLSRILTIVVPAAVATAGCGNADSEEEDLTQHPLEECIAWPSAQAGCGEGGGGNQGGDGGAGPCPSDPSPYMTHCGVGYTSIEPGAVKPGECCYDVTYGSGRR